MASEEPVPAKPEWLKQSGRVRVVDGTFKGMDGIAKEILEHEGKVTTEIMIFGRPILVNLDYVQLEQPQEGSHHGA